MTNAENGSCVGTVNVLSEDGDNRKYLDTAKDFYTKNALSGGKKTDIIVHSPF